MTYTRRSRRTGIGGRSGRRAFALLALAAAVLATSLWIGSAQDTVLQLQIVALASGADEDGGDGIFAIGVWVRSDVELPPAQVEALGETLNAVLEQEFPQFESLLAVKSPEGRPLFILFFEGRVSLRGVAEVVAAEFRQATGLPTEISISDGSSMAQMAE